MTIREVQKDDLNSLLELYTQLHNNEYPEINSKLEKLWKDILKDKNQHIVIGLYEDKIISSCVITIIQNLTRNQRPYALIENVITDENYRNKGYASSMLEFAKNIAIQENCYKIMLMTGSKQNRTLDFYRKNGYNSEDKTAFIMWI